MQLTSIVLLRIDYLIFNVLISILIVSKNNAGEYMKCIISMQKGIIFNGMSLSLIVFIMYMFYTTMLKKVHFI